MTDIEEWCSRFPVQLNVVDVRVPWLDRDHRGNPLPEQDWRFTATLPDGSYVTFSTQATATEVAECFQREGVAARVAPKRRHPSCTDTLCGNPDPHTHL